MIGFRILKGQILILHCTKFSEKCSSAWQKEGAMCVPPNAKLKITSDRLSMKLCRKI